MEKLPALAPEPQSSSREFTPLSRNEWQAGMAARAGISGEPGDNIIPPWTATNPGDTGEIPKRIIQGGALIERFIGEKGDALTDSMAQRADKVLEDFDNLPIEEARRQYDDMDPYAQQHPEAELLMRDPVLQAFALKHNLNAEQAEFPEIYDKFKEEFAAGLQAGIDQGYIPAEVTDRLDDLFNKTKVGLIDASLLNYVQPLAKALYVPSEDLISIGHTVGNKPEEFSKEHHLGHESGHKISGGTFGLTPKGEIIRKRLGFQNILGDSDNERATKVNVDEAVVEHINTSIFNGEFDIMDPDLRHDNNPLYENNRKIMATWIDRSGGIVKLKDCTRASFEDTGPEGKTIDRRVMVGQGVDAYGSGAWNTLNELCEAAGQLTYDEVKEHILPRIHGPEFDDKGGVVKLGYVDVPDFDEIVKIMDARPKTDDVALEAVV